MEKHTKVSIQIHPRAFAAFGEDLVTSDFVAITELVKNSYDAFASFSEISFDQDSEGAPFIEIRDDGFGMTTKIIETAWATVATPYKQKNPIAIKYVNGKKKERRVSGNKGLGRFSAARLGKSIQIITKSKDDPCVEATFDWDALSQVSKLDECYITLNDREDNPFSGNIDQTGTIIRIGGLKTIWNENRINELKDELARLISPFDQVADFSIRLVSYFQNVAITITPHEFIKNPIYRLSGIVTAEGTIKWDYQYSSKKKNRIDKGIIVWNPKSDLIEQLSLIPEENSSEYRCGPFTFEIRAWDLDAGSVTDVANRYDIRKSDIRKNISLYKGLSVYRDSVLVLPKSNASRDWLGLDARRISELGRRISTSQIVGIVNISAEQNSGIKDTTDREKLVDTVEYKQFIQIIDEIIERLQIERSKDRVEKQKKGTLQSLLSPLSAKELRERVELAESTGANAATIVQYVKDYEEENEKNLNDLNARLIYYAQTASLGSVSIVILHEFLTGTTAIKRYLVRSENYTEYFDTTTKTYLDSANNAHRRITEVALSFSPLYRRNLQSEDHMCNLKETVCKSVQLISAKKMAENVDFRVDIADDISVAISDGELQTILINLYDNSCYWLDDSNISNRVIQTTIEDTLVKGRISINVSDNGPGISEEDMEKVFLPGITSKQRGIGMGLVIVTELLSNYEGRIGVRTPGDINGATFVFDVPFREDNA